MGSLRGRYMLDCNRIDFRFIRLQAAGRLGRLGGRQAWPVGLLQEASSVWWHGQQRQAAGSAQRLNCAHFLGGTAQKFARMRDSRSWNWRALIWETGVRVYAHYIVSGFAAWLDTARHGPWQARMGIHFFVFSFFWLALGSSFFETLKRRGNTVKRSSQSWENLNFHSLLFCFLKI